MCLHMAVFKKIILKLIKFIEKILPRNVFIAFQNNLILKSTWMFLKQNRGAYHYFKYRNRPVKENYILYDSYYGAGMICNPYAIFKMFMDNPKHFNKFKHIWSIAEKDEVKRLKKEYSGYNNVIFILKNKHFGKKYARYLATAKYLIQNTTYEFYFAKRDEQIYVNTWHSITVKTLGQDMPNGKVESRNLIRNFMQCDYIISANPFMTRIFRESFRLQGLYEGKIIEEGHPRNDLLLSADKDYVMNKLKTHGVSVDPAKKIILYAPTWRGQTVGTAKNDAVNYLHLCAALSKSIDLNNYQLLIKPHQFVYKKLTPAQKVSGHFIPQHVDTNELLSVVDILISDYSSIYFDFMLTNRPIVFYLPDLEDYNTERGIYFNPEDLPGPVATELNELCGYFKNIEQSVKPYALSYAKTKEWACVYDDGAVSQRIIDIVFNKNLQYNIFTDFIDKRKKRVLFYSGAMAANGLTEVFFTFLNGMDYGKFDVSVCCISTNRKNIYRISDNARVFASFGTYTATILGMYKMQHFLKHGFTGKYDAAANAIFAIDFRRKFGEAQFDYVVDFSGYGVFYAALLSQAFNAKKIIWQHNDLAQDFNNKEKASLAGKKTVSLNSVLSVYHRYDKIVSVCKPLMEVNRKFLSNEKTTSRYTYVTNPVNTKRIEECMEFVGIEGVVNDGKGIIYDSKNHVLHYLFKQFNIGVQGRSFPIPMEDGAYKFVTMGRISPEKNHEALINAFARFHQLYPKSVLHIIGNGALKGKLNQHIRNLKLEENAFIHGNLENPFVLMNHCDCFIFPSRYEGMPLVVYEARYLKMPIIVSNFTTVKSVCIPNGQLVIGMEEEDIYNGLIAFKDGKVPTDYKFDTEAYNAECYRQFEALFE